jgi:hypothetical protein
MEKKALNTILANRKKHRRCLIIVETASPVNKYPCRGYTKRNNE